jgi:hypothetical protein
MSKLKKLALHIGYPKTGTTSVQKILSEEEILSIYDGTYLGLSCSSTPRMNERLEYLFCHVANGSLDLSIYQEIADLINHQIAHRESGIISHEGILRPKNFTVLHKQMALLRDLGGFDMCVFVTTRNPLSWVRSRTRHDRDLMGHSSLYQRNRVQKILFSEESLGAKARMALRAMKNLIKSFTDKHPNYLASQLRFDYKCSFPSCRADGFSCFCSKYRDGIKEINLGTLDYNGLSSGLSRSGVSNKFLSLEEDSVSGIVLSLLEFASGHRLGSSEMGVVMNACLNVGRANDSTGRSLLSKEEEDLLDQLSCFYFNGSGTNGCSFNAP